MSKQPTKTSGRGRLEEVLRVGESHRQRAAPTEPVAPTSMMHDGDANPLAPHNAMPYHSTRRSVLVIKGLAFGLPDEKIEEAFREAVSSHITTVVWDGDPLGYVGPQGEPAPSSFVRVVNALGQQYAGQLEFIYFKKEKNVTGLFADLNTMKLDKDALEKGGITQYIGPIPWLTSQNTTVLSPQSALPPLVPGRNYAVAFSNDLKWDRLGLEGLSFLKQKAGVDTVRYLIVGNPGYAVKKELKKLDDAKEDGSFDATYPQLQMTTVAYERPK